MLGVLRNRDTATVVPDWAAEPSGFRRRSNHRRVDHGCGGRAEGHANAGCENGREPPWQGEQHRQGHPHRPEARKEVAAFLGQRAPSDAREPASMTTLTAERCGADSSGANGRTSMRLMSGVEPA
jgi:hypothetical protein